MAMAEDLTAFMQVSEFASNATLAGLPVVGIFDAAYLMQDMGTGLAASTPALTLASAYVPASVVDALVVIGVAIYKVVEPMPDGTGITVLRLRVAP